MLTMNVLDFSSYEEYLDNFITINDVRYIRNLNVSRCFIQHACGKSCMGRLLSRDEFIEKRKKMHNLMHPRVMNAAELFGRNYHGNDNVLQQFAKREYQLYTKQLAASTIVFLMMRSKKGLEVSSFIDLEQSFREARFKSTQHYVNWPAIFEGKARLTPQSYHLSFFDGSKNKVVMNGSENFQVFPEGAHSLLLIHRGDHKIVCVNGVCHCSHTKNVFRTMHSSSIYGHCIFFDHLVRRVN
ncbi:hypothetical protein KR093_002596 [Drosophila rubida]|uniref:Cilia- and flagella-associated protein 299 n=1 Tax=Drosophila rubida TaxID=30044 RepID=A0AAD4PLV7_9MUSC|nr:hypothetical protein KR093_002596 [Drosophila rubida]